MNSNDPSSPSTATLADPRREFTTDDVAALTGEGPQTELPNQALVRELRSATGDGDVAVSPGAAPTEGGATQLERAAAPEIGRAVTVGAPAIIPVLLRTVSGRYLATTPGWRLELRVDVDGVRPTKRVSGDYYQVSGATVNYFGSFIVNSITLAVSSTLVTITGVATTTWPTAFNRISVRIPRVSILNPPAPATVQWFNAAGSPGATYIAAFQSRLQRSVVLEQDSEVGIVPFVSYNTGSLPSGGPARVLSIVSAYAEAGVEMITGGVPNVLPAAPGADHAWDNRELHDAMVTHFSLWREVPQWKVWLLHASRYVDPAVLGIMFDQQGLQRQGCAVFYRHPMMNGTTAAHLRTQLYCCTHELGHCHNLFHSFHKQFMNPPMPNRPDSLSWMNYPQNYTGGAGGAAAFWAAFAFQFDDLELIHLRHALRNNIIMGGNPFGTGAALEAMIDFAEPVEDRSGLKLELRTDRVFKFGEPVVVELKLSATGGSVEINPHLHPDKTFVRIAIQKPGGATIVHEPPIEKCVAIETTRLASEQPARYESAYIGYGEDGMVFDQPGTYKLRAVYAAVDGSRIVSNTLELKVRPPVSEADADVADLMMGDEQGMLFYLRGSDSEHLLTGNTALQTVAEKYATHPLALYVNFIAGRSLARPFRRVTADGKSIVRRADPKKAIKLLSKVVEQSKTGRGLDNITLSDTMIKLARLHKEVGDTKAAEDTVNSVPEVFKAKNVKSSIVSTLAAKAAAALKEEPDTP